MSQDLAAADESVVDFTAVIAEEAGQTVAHIAGEIDIATCERLRDAIEPQLAPGQRVVLDLAGVRFMDSACLHVLVQARTTLTADGGSLILRNPSPVARRVLQVAGLAELFEVGYASVELGPERPS
jgi:anti-anti-sigma factor